MKLSSQTLRLPVIMSGLAWFTERSKAECNGFRGVAIPLGPENLENQPGHPETFPNQIVYVKFAQFWALAHLPNSGQRNCAAVPECQASVGSQSAAERSLENPRAQALLANSFMDLGP